MWEESEIFGDGVVEKVKEKRRKKEKMQMREKERKIHGFGH